MSMCELKYITTKQQQYYGNKKYFQQALHKHKPHKNTESYVENPPMQREKPWGNSEKYPL